MNTDQRTKKPWGLGEIRLPKVGRARLLSDLAIFLLKSGAEAILDVLVMPVAITAGALDFLAGPKHSHDLFYRMMAVFKRIDDRIDQFAPIEPETINRMIETIGREQ